MLSMPRLGSTFAASASETVITWALGAGDDDAVVSPFGMTWIAITPAITAATARAGNRTRLVRPGLCTAPGGSRRTRGNCQRATATMGPALSITGPPAREREARRERCAD